MTEKGYEAVMGINLCAARICAQEFARARIAAGGGGSGSGRVLHEGAATLRLRPPRLMLFVS